MQEPDCSQSTADALFDMLEFFMLKSDKADEDSLRMFFERMKAQVQQRYWPSISTDELVSLYLKRRR